MGNWTLGNAGYNDINDFGWPYDQKYTWKYAGNEIGLTTPGANDIKVQCKGNTFFENL